MADEEKKYKLPYSKIVNIVKISKGARISSPTMNKFHD